MGKATPIYLSEMAPPKWRGAFNTSFQFFIGIGVVASNCINYGTAKLSWGWRLSLGLAIVPSVVMTLGALFISDTPSSLVERGKMEKARHSLRKARGKDIDIEPELAELIKISEAVRAADEEPFVTILERQYRPHLAMAFAIPFFQQLTGINIIAFYAPVLFQSVGYGSDSALIASIILGVVNLGSILVSTFVVDRYGRRFLFIQGGIQMIVSLVCSNHLSPLLEFPFTWNLRQCIDIECLFVLFCFVMAWHGICVKVVVACLLGVTTGVSGTKKIEKVYAVLVLVFMCIYAAGFGWSWGPLSWLIPSEIFPMKIRSTGQSISVAVNFATTFVLAETFLSMLCHFKFGTFLFYSGWLIAMTIFVIFFVPETKGIPLECMYQVWERHWFWRRYVASP